MFDDHGPIIPVPVLDAGQAGPTLAEGPKNQLDFFKALLDTGASQTCISSAVASKMSLTPVGKRRMSGATGVADVNEYAVDLIIPMAYDTAAVRTNIRVMEFAHLGDDVQMLIGRDIICTGALTVSYEKRFTFSL